MADVRGKPEFVDPDPEKISQLLELQLAQKRAEWKQASARYRNIRAAGFLFLSMVIIGALFAFFVVFSRVNDERANRPTRNSSTPGR
jgi:hypothetical protein